MPSMTITVPDAKWPRFKELFLLAEPNDSDESDNVWIKSCIKRKIKRTCLSGLDTERNLAKLEVDEDIVEVT